MTDLPQTVLIYGGSFDPPHRGHTTLPLQAADQVGAERVIFVPAGKAPHKTHGPAASAEHRLAMLRLALRGEPRAEICTWELEQDGPSFTVDTLEYLAGRFHETTTLRLLIGADMALIFPTWREPERIEAIAEPLVMLRAPQDRNAFLAAMAEAIGSEAAAPWADRLVETKGIDAASSAVRAAMGRGDHDAGDALDPTVLEYIKTHGLYVGKNA